MARKAPRKNFGKHIPASVLKRFMYKCCMRWPRIPTVTKNKFRDYRIFRALENLEVPLTRKDVSAEITTIFAVATEVTKAKACEKDPQSGG
ncbi:hypothetical protein VTJ04DRAFT_3917 [Mycothermus thermophilus]|uniref:uncharacterized protein n=1 Tax=Humicola insolens TaxID=85995 RepID=UPI00374376C5